MITFEDLVLNQKIFISKSGDFITKLIGYDGKMYIEDSRGNRTETDGSSESQSTRFIGSEVKPDSEVTKDIYNSEEVYVVKYKGKKNMTNIISVDVYEYFSIKTGLFIALKQVTKFEKNGESIMLIDFSDYKEVQGVLVSHTQNSTFKTKTDTSVNEIKSKVTKKIQINIDTKDFQENCFKKPEKCFKNLNKN